MVPRWLRAEPPYAELRAELRAEPPYAKLRAELRAGLMHREPLYSITTFN